MTEWNDTLDRISLYFLKNTKNVDQEKIRRIFQEKYLREIKTKDEVMVALLKQQKHRQQLYYTKQLSDLFQDRILFMKGVLVSYDLYGSIDIRDSHDIDIVVKEKDIRDVGEYLLNENFECSIKKENWERETDKNHLVFKKIVFSRVSVVIELHKYIFNPARFYPKVTELIWKRAIKKKMLGIEPWMMDVYDQVIHYCLHFYIHSMELENFSILGLDIGFRIQPMLDIYYTIKKYNISYDILYERVYELGVASEFYDVWKLINNIFPDVYSELFETRMKCLTANLIYNEQNFWRERISLKEAMDHFFSRDYISWCTEFIRYDYSNMEYLNYQWKDIFSFHSEKFQFLCQGKANQGIQVRFEFDVREKYDINKAEIWIYYRFNNQENVYLRNLKITFSKNEESYVCKFFDGIMRQEYSFQYEFKHCANENELVFVIPMSCLQADFVTYSVNFFYSESRYVCVSGKARMNFETMRHLKLK